MDIRNVKMADKTDSKPKSVWQKIKHQLGSRSADRDLVIEKRNPLIYISEYESGVRRGNLGERGLMPPSDKRSRSEHQLHRIVSDQMALARADHRKNLEAALSPAAIRQLRLSQPQLSVSSPNTPLAERRRRSPGDSAGGSTGGSGHSLDGSSPRTPRQQNTRPQESPRRQDIIKAVWAAVLDAMQAHDLEPYNAEPRYSPATEPRRSVEARRWWGKLFLALKERQGSGEEFIRSISAFVELKRRRWPMGELVTRLRTRVGRQRRYRQRNPSGSFID